MAVAYVGTATGAATGSAGVTLTFAYTTPAGANRFLIVATGVSSTGRTVSGITYGGVALSSIGSIDGTMRSELWYLDNAGLDSISAGEITDDVVVTFANTGNRLAAAGSFTGVDQVDPLGSPVTDTSGLTTLSSVVSSQAGEMVVDSATVNSVGTITVGAQDERLQHTITSNICHGFSTDDGAASVDMSWSWASNHSAAQIAVALQAAADISIPLFSNTYRQRRVA